MRASLDRAADTLGACDMINDVFSPSASSNDNVALVPGPAQSVCPVLGAVAVAERLTGRRVLVGLVAFGGLAATVVQLVQFGDAPG